MIPPFPAKIPFHQAIATSEGNLMCGLPVLWKIRTVSVL
jgi:hypothetical protein